MYFFLFDNICSVFWATWVHVFHVHPKNIVLSASFMSHFDFCKFMYHH